LTCSGHAKVDLFDADQPLDDKRIMKLTFHEEIQAVYSKDVALPLQSKPLD
jgi:hypothetical protein